MNFEEANLLREVQSWQGQVLVGMNLNGERAAGGEGEPQGGCPTEVEQVLVGMGEVAEG
jgi:hypothetical protein